jgi:hypothetical protein
VTWAELATVAGTSYAIESVSGGALAYYVVADRVHLDGTTLRIIKIAVAGTAQPKPRIALVVRRNRPPKRQPNVSAYRRKK